MEKLVIVGGNQLKGTVSVSGAKNAALKVLVAACLTDEEVIIHNVPKILDLFVMMDIIKILGGEVSLHDHTLRVRMKTFKQISIPLEKAAQARTSVMFMAPLLYRMKEAIIPNPGGCRLGARPVDRTVNGLLSLGAEITYESEDGYFHAKAQELVGTKYAFEKSTHVGTETMIIAASVANGTTILENAAEEPEIDDLISLLNAMGGNVQRTGKRQITIVGVEKLHGAECTIQPDRNEIVTFAIAAVLTRGDITITGAQKVDLTAFVEKLEEAGGGYERKADGVRFYWKGELHAVDVTTVVYPGFMTDWQAPWAVLMTGAEGTSTIHETVFENKMGYIKDLKKMGAKAVLFNPHVQDPQNIYNFNLSDDDPSYFHAVRITGPAKLHNAVMTTVDIRAGAAVVLAALAATGTSTIFGIEKLDRGYEDFEKRLASLGAVIERVNEE